MRISFGRYNIEFLRHPSRADLETKLQQSGQSFELIDIGEYARVFYTLEFRSEHAGNELVRPTIGLCFSRTGIEPQLLFSASDGFLYLGLDSTLLIFGDSSTPTKRLDLGSPFYWMTLFSVLDKLLVVHEIGLLWLDTNGDIVWRYDATDIISSVSFPSPKTLELRFFEGSRATLDLATGRQLLNHTLT